MSRAVPAALFVLAAFATVALVTHDDPERMVRATPATTISSAPVPSSAPTTTTTEPEVVRSEPIEVNRTDPVVQSAPPVQVVQPQPAPVATIEIVNCAAFLAYVPAAVIWRESRDNPNAVNASSGAMGCVQELPQHFSPSGFGTGAPGVCADLPTTFSGQLVCASRLPPSAWGL